MVIEMLLNNDIQKKIYSNEFALSKGYKCNYVHYWKNFWIKL
jgi:hypothetical protein